MTAEMEEKCMNLEEISGIALIGLQDELGMERKQEDEKNKIMHGFVKVVPFSFSCPYHTSHSVSHYCTESSAKPCKEGSPCDQ